MAKWLLFPGEGLERVDQGIALAARLAEVTLGPQGGRVIAQERYGRRPRVVQTAHEAMQDLFLDDAARNLGARLMRELAWEQERRVGDGTARALLIAGEGCRAAARLRTSGVSLPQVLGLAQADLRRARERLRTRVRPLAGRGELRTLLSTALGADPELAAMGTKIYARGPEAAVSVESARGWESSLEWARGLEMPAGLVSSRFFIDERDELLRLSRPLILLYDGELRASEDARGALDVARAQRRSLLVVARKVEGEALQLLVLQGLSRQVRTAAVAAPLTGVRQEEFFEDLAAVTGGRVLSREIGIQPRDVRPEDLGRAARAEVGLDRSLIVGGEGPRAMRERLVARLRRVQASERDDHERERREQRIARLAGRVARLRLAAASPAALRLRLALGRRAVTLARSAWRGGVWEGGGRALVRVARELGPCGAGLEAELARGWVTTMLEAPFRGLARQRGESPAVALERLDRGGAACPLDAAAVELQALDRGASLALAMLQTACVVVAAPDPDGRVRREVDPWEH